METHPTKQPHVDSPNNDLEKLISATEERSMPDTDQFDVHLFINPEDPQGDDVRRAAEASGLRYGATSAYSGYTEAEFGGIVVAGADRIIRTFESYRRR